MLWSDWPFITTAILAWIGAVMFAQRGLWWDPGRQRRRCPKCWYDMQGVPGLRCPECGRLARSERGLHRPRRSFRQLAAALSLLALGAALFLRPIVHRGGWIALAPTWALIAWDACMKPAGSDLDVLIRYRIADDDLNHEEWAWQVMRQVRKHADTLVPHRAAYPASTSFDLNTSDYIDADELFGYDAIGFDAGDGTSDYGLVHVPAQPPGASSLTLTVIRRGDWGKRAGVYGTITLPVRFTSTIDEALPPAHGPEYDSFLKTAFTRLFCLHNLGDGTPARLASTAFGVLVEVKKNGGVFCTLRGIAAPGKGFQICGTEGDYAAMDSLLNNPDADLSAWTLRITTDPAAALSHIGATSRWVGDITMPLDGALPPAPSANPSH